MALILGSLHYCGIIWKEVFVVKLKLIPIILTLTILPLIRLNSGQSNDDKTELGDKKVMNNKAVTIKKYSNRVSFKEHGFQFYLNDVLKKYLDNGLLYMIGMEYPNDFPMKFITIDDYNKAKLNSKEAPQLQQYEKDLFLIKIIDKNNDILQSNIEELSKKYEKSLKIGEAGNFEYYIYYNDKFDSSNLSEMSKEQVNNIEKSIEFLLNNIEIFEPINTDVELENLKKIEFKGKTIDGKDIDDSIFKKFKVTIIDFWLVTKFDELQLGKVQEFYNDNKDKGINVVGVILNGDEEKERAEAIINYNCVKFSNIILDRKYRDKIDKILPGVPIKIFVDSKGNILGKAMVGDNYKEELEKRIKNLNWK